MRPWAGLLAFAALAFGLSWTAWALQWALSGVAPLASDVLGRLATYGPGMAAVLSSRSWRTPNTRSPTRTTLLWPLATLALAVLVTWGDVRHLSQHLTRLAAALLALSWAAPVGFVWLACRGSGGLSPRRSLTTWRVRIGWWMLTVTMTGGAFLLGHALLALVGGLVPNFRHAPALSLTPGAAATTVLWSLLYGGPLGEEPGWRGHALPEPLARTDPLRGSVLLGVAWGVWHLPLHVIGAYDAALPVHPPLLVALALRVGSSVALSIVFTWLFLRTDGNLLLAVTLHLAANLSTGWLLPVGAGTSVGLILLAALLAVQGHLWRPQPGRATPVIVR